ncbi:MAG: RT0821/Lpp0805 family surface protein [Rhodospirillales bacterium]
MRNARFRGTVLLLAAALLLSACATQGRGREIGTVVGAQAGTITGAIVGSQIGGSRGWSILGAVVGLAAGAIIGSFVGAALDRQDREKADEAYDAAYLSPEGEPVVWENAESGNAGTVRAAGESFTRDGRPCRTFEHAFVADGELFSDDGVACQEEDGSWRLQ